MLTSGELAAAIVVPIIGCILVVAIVLLALRFSPKLQSIVLDGKAGSHPGGLEALSHIPGGDVATHPHNSQEHNHARRPPALGLDTTLVLTDVQVR